MNVGDWWRGALIVLVTIAGAAWFLFAEHEIAGTWGYSLDDSWIYATYAKNLATGNGYVFNPGEHVAGATGPLYVFLLALIYLLFQDVVLPAKVMGVACLAASGILLSKTVHRVLPHFDRYPLVSSKRFDFARHGSRSFARERSSPNRRPRRRRCASRAGPHGWTGRKDKRWNRSIT